MNAPVAEIQQLVLLSGMLGDATIWTDVTAELMDVCRAEFPRIDQHESITAIALSVLAAAPRKFALAGHSLGGIVALEIIRKAPERVSRLALLNTSAREPSDEQRGSWAALASRTKAGAFHEIAVELGRETLPASRRDPDLVYRNITMATTVGAEGFARQLTAQASRPDFMPTLARISVPTLVLTGGLDHVCPPLRQDELASGIPSAKHVTLRQVGHMSPLEAPQQVAAALREWLTAS